jgi:hypothetical protein
MKALDKTDKGKHGVRNFILKKEAYMSKVPGGNHVAREEREGKQLVAWAMRRREGVPPLSGLDEIGEKGGLEYSQ